MRCAIEVQTAMVERNAGLPPERRIEFRVGIHLGDVVEESDGDLMGDGVNIAARLEGVAKPGSTRAGGWGSGRRKRSLVVHVCDTPIVRANEDGDDLPLCKWERACDNLVATSGGYG